MQKLFGKNEKWKLEVGFKYGRGRISRDYMVVAALHAVIDYTTKILASGLNFNYAFSSVS